MYLGIDIGGTKTLIAAFSDNGEIAAEVKFATSTSYAEFLKELAKYLRDLPFDDFRAGCIAAPGTINRQRGLFEKGGNLHWQNEPLQHDAELLTKCPMLLDNDANLAGLSEALLLKDEHAKVLYITVSTGIGTGFIVNQKIDPSMADSEGGMLMLQRGDKIMPWEDFASGKAIAKRYGKQASEITDQATWQAVAADLSLGIIDLLAVTQPDIIVMGGGVGHYLDKFHAPLMAELKKYETPLVPIPPIVNAKRPDQAVIYGCYDLVRSHYA